MGDTSSRGRRIWRWLITPLMFGIPVGAFIALFLFISFHGVMYISNQNGFCFSCHLSMDTIVQEYKVSSHYIENSETGEVEVHATCADCHVPNDFVGKVKVKILALADIYYMLEGRITKQNFEQHRSRLAEKVWQDMLASDSQTCRDCHQGDNFILEQQPQRAKLNHQLMESRNETCIDCHTGIAHKRVTIE